MNVSTTTLDQTTTVRMQGRFDFSAHREFRQAIKDAVENASVRTIQLDMSGVDYIDSAALGMLLLSRENAQSASKSVTILNPSVAAKQVLDIANFAKLFTIN